MNPLAGAALLLIWSMPPDATKFHTEAPTAWAKILASHRSKDSTRRMLVDGVVATVAEIKRLGDGSVLVHSKPAKSGFRERIWATNQRHSFSIVKAAADGFLLENVEPAWPPQSRQSAEELVAMYREADLARERGESPKVVTYNKSYESAAPFLSDVELGCSGIGLTLPIPAIPWNDPAQVTITEYSESVKEGRQVALGCPLFLVQC